MRIRDGRDAPARQLLQQNVGTISSHQTGFCKRLVIIQFAFRFIQQTLLKLVGNRLDSKTCRAPTCYSFGSMRFYPTVESKRAFTVRIVTSMYLHTVNLDSVIICFGLCALHVPAKRKPSAWLKYHATDRKSVV